MLMLRLLNICKYVCAKKWEVDTVPPDIGSAVDLQPISIVK